MVASISGDPRVSLHDIARKLIDVANTLDTSAIASSAQFSGPVELAKLLLRERRLRERHFDKELFADPVWDLLLDLYIAHEEGRDISMSSAAIAANVSPTTALRYIAMMVDKGMIVRRENNSDGRRVYVALSAETLDGVAKYLASAMVLRSN